MSSSQHFTICFKLILFVFKSHSTKLYIYMCVCMYAFILYILYKFCNLQVYVKMRSSWIQDIDQWRPLTQKERGPEFSPQHENKQWNTWPTSGDLTLWVYHVGCSRQKGWNNMSLSTYKEPLYLHTLLSSEAVTLTPRNSWAVAFPCNSYFTHVCYVFSSLQIIVIEICVKGELN